MSLENRTLTKGYEQQRNIVISASDVDSQDLFIFYFSDLVFAESAHNRNK